MTKIKNPKQEVNKITRFIKKTLKKQDFKKVVIAVSGGIDSSTTLLLLSKAIEQKNISVFKLPYGKQDMKSADLIIKQAKIPKKNVYNINIKPVVDEIASCHSDPAESAGEESQWDHSHLFRMTKKTTQNEKKIRLGNIMARCRMIFLYDQAKKQKALVCGTENKSEHLLGYFTRFGDEASDIEPIRHLYKTQVYQLAKFLKVSQEIIDQTPSAGLWKNQTDEKEMGFTYKEADQILHFYLEEKLSEEKIIKKGFKNTKKIIKRLENNQFKHQTPYSLSSKE